MAIQNKLPGRPRSKIPSKKDVEAEIEEAEEGLNEQ